MKFKSLILTISLCILVTACRNTTTGQTQTSAPTPTSVLPAPTNTVVMDIPPTQAEASPTFSPEPAPTATTLPPTEQAAPVVDASSVVTATLAAPTAEATQETPAVTEQPAATPAPGEAPAQETAQCSDIVAYYADVTIPDGTSFQQGESFVKTWRIKNVGTCSWDSGYSLVFAGGEVMNAPIMNPLEPIPPGAVTDISVTLTAPPRGGVYRSNWEFRNPSGEHFGVGSSRNGPLWAEISVLFFIPPAGETGGNPEATPEPVSGTCPATRDQSYEEQVLTLINQGRISLGLQPLSLQEALTAAAVEHSTDMACNNFVDHIGSDGNLWYARVERQGYANYNSARENIYVGNPEFGGTPAGAYQWWFNSSVHYANMFNPDVSEIGIGYVSNPEAEYFGYYTTVFARP